MDEKKLDELTKSDFLLLNTLDEDSYSVGFRHGRLDTINEFIQECDDGKPEFKKRLNELLVEELENTGHLPIQESDGNE